MQFLTFIENGWNANLGKRHRGPWLLVKCVCQKKSSGSVMPLTISKLIEQIYSCQPKSHLCNRKGTQFKSKANTRHFVVLHDAWLIKYPSLQPTIKQDCSTITNLAPVSTPVSSKAVRGSQDPIIAASGAHPSVLVACPPILAMAIVYTIRTESATLTWN